MNKDDESKRHSEIHYHKHDQHKQYETKIRLRNALERLSVKCMRCSGKEKTSRQ